MVIIIKGVSGASPDKRGFGCGHPNPLLAVPNDFENGQETVVSADFIFISKNPEKEVSELKNNMFVVRMSDYEREALDYFAKKVGMSCAEVLRLGLRLIQTDTQPSHCDKLKNLYKPRESDENKKQSCTSKTG